MVAAMMHAMSNPATIAGSDSNAVLADSAPMKVGEEPSPQPSPWKGEVARSAGEGRPREIGGREGLDPTRYGDWEKSGRCIDF